MILRAAIFWWELAHLLHMLPNLSCLVVLVASCVRDRSGGSAPAGLRAILRDPVGAILSERSCRR